MQFLLISDTLRKPHFQLTPLPEQGSMKIQMSTYSNVIVIDAISLLLPWNQVFHVSYLSRNLIAKIFIRK